MKIGAIYSILSLGIMLTFVVGCKSQKPVGLTNIPAMEPIVKTITVPGPAQSLPPGGTGGIRGGDPIGLDTGGNTGGITGGNSLGPGTEGNGFTTIVEIPPENIDLGKNFNSGQVEDRDTFLAQMVHFDFDSSAVIVASRDIKPFK